MLLAHKVALDPTNVQATALARHCGYARVAFNWGLAHFTRGLDNGIWWDFRTIKRDWNAAQRDEFPWCAGHSQHAAKNALHDLGAAITSFCGRTPTGNTRAGRTGFPRFRKRRADRSYRADNGPGTVHVEGCRVRLPAVGWVRMREALRWPGAAIRQATVSQRGGRWFVSLLVETGEDLPGPKLGPTVGADLGVRTLLFLSDGTQFENPAPLRKALRSLRRVDKAIARSQTVHGRTNHSNRRDGLYRRRARLHKRIADIRLDGHHKIADSITKNGAKVVLEDLNVAAMVRNRKLARVIADSAMAQLARLIEQKAAMRGVAFEKVSRWFPSSRRCSACGERNAGLRLADRTWRCKCCGAVHDRDWNAAKNIKAAGRSPETENGRGGRVSPLPGAAMASDASTGRLLATAAS